MYRKDNKIFYVFFQGIPQTTIETSQKTNRHRWCYGQLGQNGGLLFTKRLYFESRKIYGNGCGQCPLAHRCDQCWYSRTSSSWKYFQVWQFHEKIYMYIFISQKVNNINNFQQKCGPRTQRWNSKEIHSRIEKVDNQSSRVLSDRSIKICWLCQKGRLMFSTRFPFPV